MDNPLSRRLLLIAGLLSVLLIAVVVNYLLHDGSEVLNPIAEAAQRTAAQPGSRLKVEMSYSVEGSSESISGAGIGAFNARTGRSRIDLAMQIPGQGSVTVTTVGDQRTSYTRSSALAAKLPAGKEWLGVEPLLGHSPEEAFGSGPGAESTIDMLQGVGGDVEELDHQVVRGHRTTRYKATIDVAHVADVLAEHGEAELAKAYETVVEKGLTSIPVEVWVDENGLARLVHLTEELPTWPGGPILTIDMRIEYFDFGIQPKIDFPPEDRVYDYTPVLREELGVGKTD